MRELLRVVDLKKYFPVRTGFISELLGRRKYVKAVDGINFTIEEGKVACLVGESGCGKTTTGRVILRLIEPTAGKILFDGVDVTELSEKELGEFRRRAQIIFQDPYESLDPRSRVFDILLEPVEIHFKSLSYVEKREMVHKTLEGVKLPPDEYANKFPHELSGGERQRVAIGRAMILNPNFIVADEPVSMLDASVRVEILNLLESLIEKYKLTLLYITHDLAQARYIGDEIIVMYLGKIVEMGTVDEVLDSPMQPYTQALISNVPIPDPTYRVRGIKIKGEVPNPIDLPPGCRFRNRCPFSKEICKTEPKLKNVDGKHYVACHLI